MLWTISACALSPDFYIGQRSVPLFSELNIRTKKLIIALDLCYMIPLKGNSTFMSLANAVHPNIYNAGSSGGFS